MEPEIRGRVALPRRIEYRKALELGQAKRPVRAILRQPKPELEGELGLKPSGQKLIVSKPNFGKFWIILERPGGPFITTIRMDVHANFLSRNGGRAMAGCDKKIQMKLNGRAPRTNSYIHSVTNLAAETAR
jgi:hypothetical protein